MSQVIVKLSKQLDKLTLKIATFIHKIRRTEKDDCSSASIIIPPIKVCSYSFIKKIPRIVMVSEVKEAANGSKFEPAGNDPPFDTSMSSSLLYIYLSLGFVKCLFSVKFR
jgi:hypothetical protein